MLIPKKVELRHVKDLVGLKHANSKERKKINCYRLIAHKFHDNIKKFRSGE